MVQEEHLLDDDLERYLLYRKYRRHFLMWLFLNVLYWGYILYAMITSCPFFFGDLTFIQQFIGVATVMAAPFMPLTYYAILGIFLTLGLSSSFDKLK